MLFGNEFFEFVIGGIYFDYFIFGNIIRKKSVDFSRNRIGIGGYQKFVVSFVLKGIELFERIVVVFG
jgi:hypothetical protein